MRTNPRRRRALIALAVSTTVMTAACSGGNEVADLTTIATAPTLVDTSDAETVAAADPPAATSAPTTEAMVTTTAADDAVATSVADTITSGPDGPRFSDALGTPVDRAPGVNTRGDTRLLLDAGLYVHIAWEPDPNDPSVFTVQPDDVEILEAYANAVATYYRAATTTVTTEDPAFARYVVDPDAMFGTAFRQAREGDFVLDLGSGVLLRPYIVDRSPDAATIYDCYLQDELYVSRGTTRASSDLSARGQVITLQQDDGVWRVDGAAALGSACL